MNIFFELEKITDIHFDHFKSLIDADSLKLFEEGYGYQYYTDLKIKKILFKKIQGYFFTNKLEGSHNYLLSEVYKANLKEEINSCKNKFNFIMICRDKDISF